MSNSTKTQPNHVFYTKHFRHIWIQSTSSLRQTEFTLSLTFPVDNMVSIRMLYKSHFVTQYSSLICYHPLWRSCLFSWRVSALSDENAGFAMKYVKKCFKKRTFWIMGYFCRKNIWYSSCFWPKMIKNTENIKKGRFLWKKLTKLFTKCDNIWSKTSLETWPKCTPIFVLNFWRASYISAYAAYL